MNKLKLLIVLLVFPFAVHSQDVLTTTTGMKISIKILEATHKKIRYVYFANQQGPVQTISREDVAGITYADDKMNTEPGKYSTNSKAIDDATLGRQDAEIYYRPGPAVGATFATTAVTGGILGLIPAIACSSTPPADKHLYYPDSTLMERTAYREAYITTAKKIKQRKVWGAYGMGIATAILLSVIVSLSGQ